MAVVKIAPVTMFGGAGGLITLLLGWLVIPQNEVNSNIILKAGGTPAAACPVGKKDDEVRVKRNGKLVWTIADGSCTRNEAVMVGNFRTTEASSAKNCDNPTEGANVEWPFQESIKDAAVRRRKGNKIELRLRSDVTIPGSQPSVEYFYDVCTGSQNLKSDPKLVIER
jgi:hypothetical protein